MYYRIRQNCSMYGEKHLVHAKDRPCTSMCLDVIGGTL